MAKQYSSPPDMQIDPARRYTAEIETSAGTMTAELYADDAPKTVNNFVFLADLDADLCAPAGEAVLAELRRATVSLRLLGCYPAATPR